MKNMAQKALEEFGRDGFYVVKTTKEDCPDCILGPNNQPTTNCNTCDSTGYIENSYFVPVRGIISWKTLEERKVLIGGMVLSGDCGVAISYDDYKSIDFTNDGFIVDEREVVLSKIIPSDLNALYLLTFTYNE